MNKDMTTFSVESKVLSHSDFAQDDRFMHVKLSLCTQNQKANGMHFNKELLEVKMSDIDFMPIVGAIKIVEKDDGSVKYTLGSHEVELDIVDNELVYKKNTIVLGVALPNTAKFETISRHGESTEYITFDALLFQEKYPQLKSVIDMSTDASMELDKVEADFDEDNGWYEVKDFRYLAHCLIGVPPAFKLAGVVQQFSVEDFKLEYSSMLEDIKSSLNNIEGGGINMEEETNVVDVVVETGDTTDEENEATTDEATCVDNGSDTANVAFELSHDDIRNSIWNQLNPIGEDGYRNWNYWLTEVFDTYFVCRSETEDDAYYKFTFTKDQDTEEVSVDMESKVEVFVMYLTQEEKTALTNKTDSYEQLEGNFRELQSKFDDINGKYQEKLQKEEFSKKQDIITSYSDSLTEEEINQTIADVNMFSVEDIDIKLAARLGKKIKEEKAKESTSVFSNFGNTFPSNSKWSDWLQKMN